MTAQRQRLTPSAVQVRQARALLERVRPLAYDWTSEGGQAFLAYVADLADHGVPIAWLAEPLGLDAPRLYATLNRFRKAQEV